MVDAFFLRVPPTFFSQMLFAKFLISDSLLSHTCGLRYALPEYPSRRREPSAVMENPSRVSSGITVRGLCVQS